MKRTNGRFSLSKAALGLPSLLLTTTGARSGQRRTMPLLYFEDGESVVLIASNYGKPRHPAWYHNLRANPEATLFLRGREAAYIAREAVGEERERLWRKASALYPGYDAYQHRAGGRQIPVMVLVPR